MAPYPFLGEAACLSAALLWSVTVAMFRRPVAEYGPPTVNLAKSLSASLLLVLTALAAGQLAAVRDASWTAIGLVAASGLVGLTLGDTALLAAVHLVGVHRTLLFQSLAPVFAVLLALVFLGEAFSGRQALGIAVVLAGVVVVEIGALRSRLARVRAGGARGYTAALLAALGQGGGIVLAKGGMDELPIAAASGVRMVTATLGLLVVLRLSGRLKPALDALKDTHFHRLTLPPAILGTYVAILLMMAGVAWALASVASVLLATVPIFGLFTDRWTTGTPLTAPGVLGTAVTVVGVAVLVT